MNFRYKSFCWCFGTTSFRTRNFNKTIEEQLFLLNTFWQNRTENWTSNNKLQIQYYDFMKSNGFVKGDANNKSKDAREKTSGLVDMGLIDKQRRLTEVGKELLRISKQANFRDTNLFSIDKDSFLYLSQLLKISYNIKNCPIRPFVIILMFLIEFNYLTIDEFTYLLPLCISVGDYNYIREGIKSLRNNKTDIDAVIINLLMKLDNYKLAYEYFLSSDVVDEETIISIGMNRKSRNYDKPYFDLYLRLYDVFVLKNYSKKSELFCSTEKIKLGKYWREILFENKSKKKPKVENLSLNNALIERIVNEKSLKDFFFKFLHLFKAKATLSDYEDLNRRYISLSDVIIFEENRVMLDIMPKAYFSLLKDNLFENAFAKNTSLGEMIDIDAICGLGHSSVNKRDDLLERIGDEIGVKITSIEDAKINIERKRYIRFNALIEGKFNDENLLKLLECFENRNDDLIWEMVCDNADIPTIFEYILGIIWYKISDKKGKILDYMNLSLDAQFLPKTHASGGEADIVYEYEESTSYPNHSLLIEVTLADKNNQRRMEMEPVSRHLGNHLLKTNNYNSYCIFVTNYLNINVVADFLARKGTPFYDSKDYSKSIDGMKIIPLELGEIKNILKNKIRYPKLYKIFDEAFKSNLQPHVWYAENIKNKI